MTQNNNTSVLPWYTSIEEQNHRKSYAQGDIFPLIAPANILLPFQIIRTTRANPVYNVTLYDANDKVIVDMTDDMIEVGLQVVRFWEIDYDVIIFPATLPMALNLPIGAYYMKLTDGADTWYSEIFTVVNDVSPFLKIEWFDFENLVFEGGQIVYKNPTFRNVLYLNTELGKPEYEFEEEGEERDGYFFPEKQISVKKYKCNFVAPEYLCDVMRFIRMADTVLITDTLGRQYSCDTFLMTPEWQEQGNIAGVTVEFKTNTVVKKLGVGYMRPTGGDFNTDYNNDFDKK